MLQDNSLKNIQFNQKFVSLLGRRLKKVTTSECYHTYKNLNKIVFSRQNYTGTINFNFFLTTESKNFSLSNGVFIRSIGMHGVLVIRFINVR